MDSILMIVRNVITDQTAQMKFVQDNHMIQELVSAASYPSFRDSILPGTCRAYAFRLHCAGSQKIGYFLAKLAITIENRVAVGTRFRECISQLLHYPDACRMFRNVEMENPAAAVFSEFSYSGRADIWLELRGSYNFCDYAGPDTTGASFVGMNHTTSTGTKFAPYTVGFHVRANPDEPSHEISQGLTATIKAW
jgi:hypothetical protein